MNERLDNVLLQGKAILEDVGVPYFLVGGTLLGIVREGSLLAHDKDVDVAVLNEDLTPEIKEKIKSHSQFRVESKAHGENGQLSFYFDDTGFDIFPMTLIGENRFFNQRGELGLWWPKDMVEKPWSDIQYRGITWKAPKDINGFLDHMYGDWHVEDKKFNWETHSLNFTKNINEI